MTAIEISGLGKTFKKHTVLDQVQLQVAEGSCCGLVGVNGAGKTTLLKCLLNFLHFDAGSIALFGEAHTGPRARANLAYLPERFYPPYYLSGAEFLRYSAQMHGFSPAADAVEKMMRALDLSSLNKPVRQYSKGMAQKLGLAACFLSGRRLLVLDEPMSGLDPKARYLVKQIMRDLHQQGVTLFFSTHMLSDVEQLCDTVAILHDRHISFSGSPESCLAEYHGESLEQAFMNCIEASACGAGAASLDS